MPRWKHLLKWHATVVVAIGLGASGCLRTTTFQVYDAHTQQPLAEVTATDRSHYYDMVAGQRKDFAAEIRATDGAGKTNTVNLDQRSAHEITFSKVGYYDALVTVVGLRESGSVVTDSPAPRLSEQNPTPHAVERPFNSIIRVPLYPRRSNDIEKRKVP